MNWLAHLLLSEAKVEHRLGNLLGDLTKGKERENLSTEILRGIADHQKIDIFTDSHPIVKQSKQRIDCQYRRFSGILVDIFYDHILANNWHNYSDIPLEGFASEIYISFEPYLEHIPVKASSVIKRAIADNWLTSYRDLDGIEQALQRISWKLTRRRNKYFNLCPAIEELTTNYQDLETDFKLFFPELIQHMQCYQMEVVSNRISDK